ncbi:unnamed protein product [Kuraishia capsulata CBS 1993]|uniref:Nucleoporin Nup133/Nup155-like C-terminal domain-containing protein n=1 Tax=Kuraishia capsulata CBS 1993 TaxID=1382522 RepID=W6MNI6_9ASCO|nr:uncharacterized protein KUCA_T00004168001 [Kuraishia capsulata CBS 1993]CDK28186.1 unnamed protein product [Kuraishia capsulata CBS 1993]
MSSIFSAKKLKASANGTSNASFSSGDQGKATQSIPSQSSTELTRSTRYKVSRLIAAPQALRVNDGSLKDALVDSSSGYALVVSLDHVLVWKYATNDSIPEVATFSYKPNEYSVPAKAVLLPSLPGSKYPGLVVIDAVSGRVRYHESVVSAPAVGFLNGKELDLKLNKEFVDKAEFVGNFTVLISTSAKRLFALHLADGAGRPCLSKSEIQSSQRSFLGIVFGNNVYDMRNYLNSSRIVALRSGRELNSGMRELIVQDSDGNLSLFQQGNGSVVPISSHNIKNDLCSPIAEIYPHIRLSFRVEDLQLLASQGLILLASFDKEPSTLERYLILFTISVDETGVSVHSSYRLTSYIAHGDDKNSLFLPSPYSTAFVVSGGAVVLTDVPLSLSANELHSRKWEDFVRFRSNVTILGFGCEDQTDYSNASCIAVSDGYGLLRVEKYSDDAEPPLELEFNDSVSLIKSHIEQAIIFGGEDVTELNPLFFDLSSGLRLLSDDVQEAIQLTVAEILTSESRYLPSFVPSLESHLKKRFTALKNLAYYVRTNFLEYIDEDIKLLVLNSLEKIAIAKRFYGNFNNPDSTDFVETLEAAIKVVTGTNDGSAVIRDYFSKDVTSILDVLSAFLGQLLNSDALEKTHVDSVASLMQDVLAHAYLEIERDIRYSCLGIKSYSGSNINPPISLESDLFFKVDQLLGRFGSGNADQLKNADNEKTIIAAGLAESCYYAFNDALQWNSKRPESSSKLEISKNYGLIYDETFKNWVTLALLANHQESILTLAEFFEDFETLCMVLEARRTELVSLIEFARENEKPEFELNLEEVYLSFESYMNKFGYQFAATMYEYYISEDKLSMAFLEFPKFKPYLNEFLSDGRHGDVSWIKNVLERDYEKAASTLIAVSQTPNQNYKNKMLELSIAKLSIIAFAKGGNDASELLRGIKVQMSTVNLQQMIEEELSVFVADESNEKKVSFWKNEFSTTYLKSHKYEGLQPFFARYMETLGEKYPLSIPDLINFLTLVDQKTVNMEAFFYNAFKLIVLLKRESYPVSPRFIDVAERIIWLRLLVRNDWDSISDSSNNVILERVHESSLFKTVFLLMNAQFIDTSALSESLIFIPFGDDIAKLFSTRLSDDDVKLVITGEVNAEFDQSLQKAAKDIDSEQASLDELNKKYNLGEWVKSIVSTVS